MRRVREDLAPLFADGAIHEVMSITPKGHILDLRTDQLNQALDFVQRQDAAGAIGIYVGNNPLRGRVGGPDKNRPNNQSVATRVALFLDLDRAGKPKHLATHDELATLHKARQHAQDFLATRLGFPAEACRSGVSGNGEYLIYALDHLPSVDETDALVKQTERALRTIIETKYPTVRLDSVSEAVRVRRISGTINRKHDEHRMCQLDVRDQEPITREMLEALAALAPVEDRLISAQSVSLTLSDQDIVERLRNEKGGQGIAGQLLDGDKSGYSDYSSARYALAGKLYWEHAIEEQITRILRSSNLFDPANTDRERDRKAARDARKRVSEGGPQRDPNYTSAPYLSIVTTPAPPVETAPDPTGDADTHAELAAVRAELAAVQAERQAERILTHAFILRQGETIGIMRDRLRRSEEREAVYKNTELGSARNVGAVLGGVLETLTPREPDSPTPWRLYLDRLADETNQSPETCSRQLKGLAAYKGPDDTPVARVVTRTIPRHVDTVTGEIVPTAKEIWVGLSCEPSELTRILGTLAPDNAPQHGGAVDRGVCPDHPDAGVVRRERTTTRITHECRHCKKVLAMETVAGRSTTKHLDRIGGESILHDADQDDEWLPEPFAHRPHEDASPILHDADHAPGAPLDQPPNLQHAGTTVNHTPLTCNMKDRNGDDSPHVVDHRSDPAEPSWMWESPPDDPGPPSDWQAERRRVYGQLYRGEEVS